jgi:hypothetical protein
VEACDEETLAEVLDRYLDCNAHAASYTWKHLGRVLDMTKTLSENAVPDHGRSCAEVAIDDEPFTPTIFLYFNDDLTTD